MIIELSYTNTRGCSCRADSSTPRLKITEDVKPLQNRRGLILYRILHPRAAGNNSTTSQHTHCAASDNWYTFERTIAQKAFQVQDVPSTVFGGQMVSWSPAAARIGTSVERSSSMYLIFPSRL
jgi:hypothetical protein